ncbi:MAG: hypothetical protein QW097_02325 [archaeon]
MANESTKPQYQTLDSREYKYGNNFIEVAKKLVVGENAEFISISKGFYTKAGIKKYTTTIGFPSSDVQLKEFLINALNSF